MLTRRALSRQEESKLQMALLELKASKELCAQLNSEREDNEKEFLEILESKNKLKKELSLLHIEYNSINDERVRLQQLVDRFDDCSVEYEQALRRITSLEEELRDAHTHISQFEETSHNMSSKHTQSLYEELVDHDSQLVTDAVETQSVMIDLTNDTLPTRRLVNCSSNKLKKYIKINKYIRRTQKLLKQNKLSCKQLKSKKINVMLHNKLHKCAVHLENYKLKYETDTQLLELNISSLENALKLLTNKYENSQNVLSEYTLAMDELLKLSTYNAERFESMNNNLDCECKHVNGHQSVNELQQLSSDSSPTLSSKNQCNSPFKTKNTKPNIIMYSDEIGSSMGSLLNSYSRGLSVTNNCLPFSNLDNIMRQIGYDSMIHINTTLIIFVGNRGNINKSALLKFYENLNKLNVYKIIFLTIPYCHQLPQEENHLRYKLNMVLCNLSTYNNKFKVIDSNKYVSKYYVLTKGRFYLSTYCKRQIAMSLSYFIDISAKNLAINNTAFIEQSQISTLEIIPINNCLN